MYILQGGYQNEPGQIEHGTLLVERQDADWVEPNIPGSLLAQERVSCRNPDGSLNVQITSSEGTWTFVTTKEECQRIGMTVAPVDAVEAWRALGYHNDRPAGLVGIFLCKQDYDPYPNAPLVRWSRTAVAADIAAKMHEGIDFRQALEACGRGPNTAGRRRPFWDVRPCIGTVSE